MDRRSSDPVACRAWHLSGLLGAMAVLAGGTTAARAGHIRAELEAETVRPLSGSRITLALTMAPDKGWHGYWQNPGDAGAPASVAWTVPPGVKVGALRYPAPMRLMTHGLMNYVYDRPYALLATVTIPGGLAPGTPLSITGRARWLACSATLCVPEQGVVAIDLKVGDGMVATAARTRFDGWRTKLPVRLGRPARFESRSGRVRIAIPFPRDRPISDPYFFPATDRMIDYAAPQLITRRGDQLIVEARAAANGRSAASLDGMIVVGGDRGYWFTARPGSVAVP